MKKLLFFIALIVSFAFISCSSDDDVSGGNDKGAVVDVKVTNGNRPASNVTVYLFDSAHGPQTDFFDTFYAKRNVVTNSDGVATFELQDTFDLDIIDSQTTFYFAVSNGNSLKYAGVTVKKGERKSVNIRL